MQKQPFSKHFTVEKKNQKTQTQQSSPHSQKSKCSQIQYKANIKLLSS